ncbi:GNAT family N-acetyltransferase [Macrococcus caseolyticus]|nr:GNAT family N-acetyltransferase [Macrococcus caseolyticus]MCE4957113.1 GNAT family N-acetyltransferase [Macrococcus caseolyticus]
MQIRPIQQKDNPIIHKIIQTSLESFNLDIPGSAYFDPELAQLSSYYNEREYAQYWIAERDGKVIGGVGIAPFNEERTICELQKLYLLESAKGKGISKLLMDQALAFASIHYKACYLETMTKLEIACILYDKYGFKLLEQPMEGSDHTAMDRWYIKTL